MLFPLGLTGGALVAMTNPPFCLFFSSLDCRRCLSLKQFRVLDNHFTALALNHSTETIASGSLTSEETIAANFFLGACVSAGQGQSPIFLR